jgi:TPR repeat protein
LGDKQPSAQSDVEPQVIDVDPAQDPAHAWRVFLERAEYEPSYRAYDVLSSLRYGAEGVDADACLAQRDALQASIRAVPVSIALHRAAMLCAEALADSDAAERELAALAALSKYALTQYGDGAWRRPIQVVQPWDIYALTHALGYEFRYEYFSFASPKRYFPLAVVVWDPEKKVERVLQFDYIDTIAAIDRRSERAGTPTQRAVMARAYVAGMVESGEAAGFDADAIAKMLESEDPREQIKQLRAGAERGGLQSAISWLRLCTSRPFDGCADGLVDALLPQAEQQHVLPMTLLALAYRNGTGLKKDLGAAHKLLRAADARSYRNAASVQYYVLQYQIDGKAVGEEMVDLLHAASAAGSREAELLLVLRKMTDGNASRPLLPADIEVLERPENNGTGRGYAILAEHYENTGRKVQAEDALRKAAEAGEANSQWKYAHRLLTATPKPDARRTAEAEAVMRRAAHGGSAEAMRYVAAQHARASDWPGAVSWLLPAVQAGDIEATLMFAVALLTEASGLDGTPEAAYAIIEEVAAKHDHAGARIQMAMMLAQGQGVAKDLAKARALLETDAKRGNRASQSALATLLLDPSYGRPNMVEGERWLRRAAEGGYESAVIEYGSWLMRTGATPEARARGRRMLADFEGEAVEGARNNLAWALCVSRHADLRDAAAGLELAKRLEQNFDALSPGDIDTVAACYAAAGDFKRAVELQSAAIEKLPKRKDGKPDGGQGMFDRLDLFKAGKPYFQNGGD